MSPMQERSGAGRSGGYSRGPRGGSRGGRSSGREGRGGRPDGERGGRTFRKKVCRFSSGKVPLPNYKDTEALKKFVTEKGKIIPRRITGTSAKYQRQIAAIVDDDSRLTIA